MYSNAGAPGKAAGKKITVPDLRGRKVAQGGDAIAMVTAYDYTMARLVDEAGVDAILVGDSLGMVVQGLSNTIPVTLEEIAYHGRAVQRAGVRAHVVGDLPFMSYQVSVAQAVESAGRLMKEGLFESVKLEGGLEFAEQVYRLVRSGIPVMGHIGLLPQTVHALGGFKVQGRGDEAEQKLIADARAIEQAGAFAIVLEAIPPDVAARVTAEIGIPTIGIGAGAACDGQVLVCTDLLGLTSGKAPKFAKRFADLGEQAVRAVAEYVSEVRDGTFPSAQHSYKPNRPAGDHSVIASSDSQERLHAIDEPLAIDFWN
ncbi:3-methyl-2-oxobutanoate hydroxymethyltransferase [Pendulispora brunnea]|uniref:3-methyl-2-oxobutanoate hydroxymethyltransferase n=1 Tax=Pendulispora brunnea TaxID=2905690 RepID=A0ABZ2KKL1_9BACT